MKDSEKKTKWEKDYLANAQELIEQAKGKKALSLCITGISDKKGKGEQVIVSVNGGGESADLLYIATKGVIAAIKCSEPPNKEAAERLIDAIASHLKDNLKQIL